MVGLPEGIIRKSVVMVTVRCMIVAGSRYVGVVTINEWSSGSFISYICWLNYCS